MVRMDMMNSYTSGESSAASSASSIGGGEFEIARVLANLGNNNGAVAAPVVAKEEEEMRESGSVGGGNNNTSWGFKGKRSSSSNKRVKESSSLHSSSPLPFDLNVDQPSVFQDECQDTDVKMEEACESADHGRASNPPHSGGRSRHNLTEAEKEARKIRRILANRESARQTIRRRQAFHEELTRKAVELASENESLRRSKELAVKEFQTLQNANRDLKGKLSQTLGFKLGGESKGKAESSYTDNPQTANWQQRMYRKLSANPFVLPATCVQPSELSMSQLTQQYYNPSCMFTEQENALMNPQNMPLCILPCPVFLSMPNIKNNDTNQLSSLLLQDKDEGSSVDSRHLYSPSSVIRCAHNCPVVLSPDDKMGGQSQPRFSFSLDGGGQNQQTVPPMPCCSRGEREDCISSNPSTTSRNNTASALAENRKDRTVRKKEGTVAGAEARKKRKELMKLKSRLHCHLLGREIE